MNKPQAQQFLAHIKDAAGPKGALTVELFGDEDKPSSVSKNYRVKVTHLRLNRVQVVGKWDEWPTIQQAWNELERVGN